MNTKQQIARDKADAIVASAVIQEEQELADALVEITQKYGKFNSDDTGVWAGYESAEENENREIGVTCANCILYEGGSSCKIIDAEVEPGGYCRFALIPDGVVTAKKEESVQEMSFNCPVCDNGCACSVGPCNCPPTCSCPCRTGVEIAIVSAGSRRAPKKDRIYGSKKNKKGSASGGKKITFSAKTEKALANKVKEHNEKAPAGRKATLGQLKAVYRRGAGAFSSSHRPGKTRDQWAMARVNAYLKLLKSGRPSNPNYKQDNDLLPKAHPKSTNSLDAMTASVLADDELYIELLDENEYQSPEHAIVAFAEYSGLGYETIPAFRAAWMRAVDEHEVPFERAKDLAINLYSSKDADLLPKEYSDPTTLTAAFPGGDKWRSQKAKLQRRDRYGRFAEMGGGFSFVYKGPTGPAARVTGTVVGQSGEEDVDVKVKDSKVLQDGVYSVPSSKGESVKAVISNKALKQAKVDRDKATESFPSDTPFVSRKDIKKRDKKGNVVKDPEQDGPRPSFTGPGADWTRPYEPGQSGMKMPGEKPRDLTPKETEDMIKQMDDIMDRFKKTQEELEKKSEGFDPNEPRPLRGNEADNEKRAILEEQRRQDEEAKARRDKNMKEVYDMIGRDLEARKEEKEGKEKPKPKPGLDVSKLSPVYRDIIGPRKPGGKYKSGYGGEEYEVIDTYLSETGFPVIKIRGEDGLIRTHSTSWDPKRDKVISEPDSDVSDSKTKKEEIEARDKADRASTPEEQEAIDKKVYDVNDEIINDIWSLDKPSTPAEFTKWLAEVNSILDRRKSIPNWNQGNNRDWARREAQSLINKVANEITNKSGEQVSGRANDTGRKGWNGDDRDT